MQTLLIISSDDGSREGCSIFYAGYLLVDGPRAKLKTFLEGLSDDDLCEYYDNRAKLTVALAAAGLTATSVPSEYLVVEG